MKPRPNARRTTPDEDAQILAAYRARHPVRAICAAHSISTEVVRRVLREAGVPLRPRGRPRK